MNRLTVTMAVAALVCAIAPARADEKLTQHQFTSGERTRQYWVYDPAPGSEHLRPLVVFLHGCNQPVSQAIASTEFNRLADALGFVVVYPQQNFTPGSSAPLVDGNGIGCWNWFLPEHQTRSDGNEPAVIAGLTREVMASHSIDPDRVYVDGVSAGADMAVILAVSHPDLFAAAAAIAGCPFETCSDLSGARALAAMGTRARSVPLFVEQGTADMLNVYPLGQALVGEWLGLHDLLDDGMPNATVSRAPATVTNMGFDQTPAPGTGDPCVRNNNFPCAGGVIGFEDAYPTTVERYADARGCDIVDFWVIHGLNHAYPHASPSTYYDDPLGPDITSAAYDFFAAHPKGACPKP